MTRKPLAGVLTTGLSLMVVVGCGAERQPNLLLISLDTTRADHCSPYGHDRSTTPILSRLADQGMTFDTAYATTPITAPSHATLFTGKLPSNHGLMMHGQRLGSGVRTLAEILFDNGYQTAGVASSFVLDRRFELDRGFTVWEDDFDRTWSSLSHSKWGGHEVPSGFDRPADDSTGLAIRWLTSTRDPSRPFFLFVHYFEPHGPFEPPDRWRERFEPGPQATDLERTLCRYDGCIAFTDDEIGRLLLVLEQLELFDDTLVVVTADHGEGFMDHGVMSHGPHLYDEAVRIPLIMRWLGVIPAASRSQVPVSLLDVAPTIVDLLGIDLIDPKFQGASLTSLFEPGADDPGPRSVPLYRPRIDRKWVAGRWIEGDRWALRSGRWKFLSSDLEPPELYDLDLDPAERVNQAAANPRQAARLRSALEAWIGAPSEGACSETLTDDATRHGLEALGYTQSD